MSDIGFYNKYLFINNSYLRSYIVRDTVKQYGNCKNINKLIDKKLNEIPIYKIKKKAEQKKVKFNTCNVVDNCCNTETFLKKDIGINTNSPNTNSPNTNKINEIGNNHNTKIFSNKKINYNTNSSSANICNRIILNKN